MSNENEIDLSGKRIAKLFKADLIAGNINTKEFGQLYMTNDIFITIFEISEEIILDKQLLFIK